jgi:hypothetical protein
MRKTAGQGDPNGTGQNQESTMPEGQVASKPVGRLQVGRRRRHSDGPQVKGHHRLQEDGSNKNS